jgi:hypothetical protein
MPPDNGRQANRRTPSRTNERLDEQCWLEDCIRSNPKSKRNNATAASKAGAHVSLQQTDKLSTDFQNNLQNQMMGITTLNRLQILEMKSSRTLSLTLPAIVRDSKPSDMGANVKTKLNVCHGDQTKDTNILDVTRAC